MVSFYRQDIWSAGHLGAIVGVTVVLGLVSGYSIKSMPPGDAPRTWFIARAMFVLTAAIAVGATQRVLLGVDFWP